MSFEDQRFLLSSQPDRLLCAPPAIKNLRGEYYLNGHWVIEFSRSTPIAGTVLYYQRGAEGDNVPETVIGRGPTTEPLVVEVTDSFLYGKCLAQTFSLIHVF